MKLLMNHVIHRSSGHGLETKLVRCLCGSHSRAAQRPNPGMDSRPERVFEKKRESVRDHPYDHLFPWKSLSEFSHHLANTKVYFDGKLLAIEKPWGVGTYQATVNITDKNSHLSTAQYSGSPDYSLMDSVQHLSQIFNVKRLKFVKTLPRFSSGIVLLAVDETTEQRVVKALRRAHALEVPAMTFWCLTKGWPTITGSSLRERVGIKLLELDEFGDHKQPVIIGAQQLTNSMRRKRKEQSDGMVVKPALIDLKCISVNKDLGVSLVELSVNVTRWNFIECYLASKTSFIIGDSRFSKQVKHILGTPMSVKPDKMNFTQDMEPLPQKISSRLQVRGNDSIPVHIHHKRIVLPYFENRKQNIDLVISSDRMPDYFDWSLNRLNIDVKT